MHWFDRSPFLRSSRLAATVAVRATGVVPGLIACGWLLFAAGQEPRMLRLFGIELVLQAAWLAAMAVFLVTMARLPRASRIGSQIVAANGIAALVGASTAVLYAVLEGLRGGSANVQALATFGLAFLLTWVPAGLCTPLVAAGVGRIAWAGWAVWLALVVAAASQSVPHAVGDWSLRSIAASMACLASALAFAHIYGLKKE